LNRSEVIRQLKSDEGFVPHAYQDHLGYWTLGYGFLIDERRGGGIPAPVAKFWLTHEVDKIHRGLIGALDFYRTLPQPVQNALVNMAYQLGMSGLLGFRKMLAALEAGDRETAAREALASRWANQTPERAKRVAGMIRGE